MTADLEPEQLSEEVLTRVGHSRPPTNLDAVCSLWPYLKVHEEDLDKEGYLIPLGVHGAEILIRKNDPPARKKFTLAHELGHWTQAHLRAGQISFEMGDPPLMSFRTHDKRQTPEEVWCNKFAACLLMPKTDIRQYIGGSRDTNLADRISKGHSMFQVSSEAFMTRIIDVTPINVFEVVKTDASTRIGRRFLSRYRQDNQVEQTMHGILDAFKGRDGPLEELGVVDGYRVQAKLTRKSQFSYSWLVAADRVDGH